MTETKDNQTFEFLYQANSIHFLVNPKDDNVMVNATEMAKLFNKDTREFLKLEGTKKYLKSKLKSLNNDGDSPHYNEDFLVKTNKKAGTLMLRPLALKFAAWLDSDFEVWIFDTIDNVIFGNLKIYRDAMAEEVRLKNLTPTLKQKLVDAPTPENVKAYFDNQEALKSVKSKKNTASTNQLNLFKNYYKIKEENEL